MVSPEQHWRQRLKPFAGPTIRIPFSRKLSPEELGQARRGLFPASSDDRWFGLCVGDALVFARANSGRQIYLLPLDESAGGAEIGPLVVADDSAIYRRSGDAHDVSTVEQLLEQLLHPSLPPW
jgi:hypothetical protein